jgi:hypothetical protein
MNIHKTQFILITLENSVFITKKRSFAFFSPARDDTFFERDININDAA